LSISAAAYWARNAEQGSVFLVDLDFVRGSSGRNLDLENEFDLTSVLNAPDRIDLELLGSIKRDHPAGFSLLSFRRMDLQVADITSEFVYRLLDVITYRYRRVVLDLPTYPSTWTDDILLSSDEVILVAERTVPGLKNAAELEAKLLRLGKTVDSIQLVLNKDRRRMFSVGIGAREIKRLFKTSRVIVLPDNWPLASEALNRGVPINLVNRRSNVVRQFGRALGQMDAARSKK
jgi:pilus assembly protein CpaE